MRNKKSLHQNLKISFSSFGYVRYVTDLEKKTSHAAFEFFFLSERIDCTVIKSGYSICVYLSAHSNTAGIMEDILIYLLIFSVRLVFF